MDDQYDEDLLRAIELSKRETNARQSTTNHVDVIDVDEDDVVDHEASFEADLQRALEESKREAEKSTPSGTNLSNGDAGLQPAAPSQTPPTARASSFLSERQKLEQERLERLKRRRPDIHQSQAQSANAARADESDNDIEEEGQARGAKRQHISSSSRSGARRANSHTSTSYSTSNGTRAVPVPRPAAASGSGSRFANVQNIFWDGELRQTANACVDPQKDKRPTFRLSEILSPSEDIDFAIVSAYCWDISWVYEMFHRRTPVIAVDHSPTGDASIKAILPNWVRTTPFLRNGFGCMHMKFMLLFYRTGRLRVVISTANLVKYDWQNIENTVWVQDLPKHPSPVAADLTPVSFVNGIIRVLHAVNVAPALVNLLKNDHPNLPLQRLEDLRTKWDFSKVKVALVPSIAGKHEGWPKVILTGHTSLMKGLIDLNCGTPEGKELVLECQGSSVGTYSTQWLNEFYCSARGESAQSWLNGPKTRRTKLPFPPIKILFPTAQYVRDSAIGEAGGGTMFCRRNQWEGKNYPRELFHQTKSKRGRVLMHSKMVLGTFRDKRSRQRALTDSEDEDHGRDATDDEREKSVGWVYVGSHNFTPSAWGTLSGSGFSPVLNVTNYELGILIPLKSEDEINRVTCWERPPQKYVIGRDQPWIQSESPFFQAT